MSSLFIGLLRLLSLSALFLLTLLLICQEAGKWLKQQLSIRRTPKTDPLASLKKARLSV